MNDRSDIDIAPSSSEEGVGGGAVPRELLLKRAAEMRRNPTEPERRLWMALRQSRLSGYKFRRQAIIGQRIVDFFCPAKALVVEIDGDTHDAEQDAQRDKRMMHSADVRIVRFSNSEVMRNMDGVLTELERLLDLQRDRWSGPDRHHPPAPSSEEEGEI